MPSDVSVPIYATDVDSSLSSKGASPRPRLQLPDTSVYSSTSRPQIHAMDDRKNIGSCSGGIGPSLGQFSFTPATQTTVVTTTTTTTTTFPPLIIKPPRAISHLDTKLYPLASSPTPSSLRSIRFDLGGQSIIFNEPEDTSGAMKELSEMSAALKATGGVVQSVSSFTTSDESNLHRRTASPRASSRASAHPFSIKRRPVSPVSIPEVREISQRLRPNRVHSESTGRSLRSRATSAAAIAPRGLATPENDDRSLRPTEGGIPRGRIHLASIVRRESPLQSPLPSEAESQPSQDADSSLPALAMPCPRSFDSDRNPQDDYRTTSIFADRSTSRNTESRDNWLENPVPHVAGGRIVYGALEDASQQIPIEIGLIPHDMSLPSPRLSPVAAMNASAANSSADALEDPEVDVDLGLDNTGRQFPPSLCLDDSGLGDSQPDNKAAVSVTPEQIPSLTDIPKMMDLFDSVPDELKTYLMYQFLRRCPKPTLHLVADIVNPALKCDFLALLPLELSLNVIKYLDFQSMCRAAQVSKKWRHIINSDEKAWKRLFDNDGYALTDGELERAIREGWAWQFPSGDDGWERDLSLTVSPKYDYEPVAPVSLSSAANRASAGNRRPKRKATSHASSRRRAKRKISSSGTDYSEPRDWIKDISTSEGPYAAASAAAAAVPYPDIGLPSLRELHLYKSLYQRHCSIHKSWMKPHMKPNHIAFRAHGRQVVTCLQFDTDKILTGSEDTNINVYDTKTGALRATLEGHDGGVWALEYYGNTLVSGSTDRSVRVWDIERARCTQIFHGHTSTVRCLQIVLPAEIGKRADGSALIMPKEPLIITGSRDSSLRVWKLPKRGDPDYFQNGPLVDDTDCPYFVRVLTGHQHSVRAVAAHGDILVSGSYDTTVRVWKISTGETIHRLQGHTMKVYSVVLDTKRNRCISGSMDNMVKIWSLDSGSVLYSLEGHSSLVGLLDLKYDRLVSAAADSTLRIWDPETGQCKSMLSAHTGAITCFQHDGQKVISGSDRTLKMWDVQTGECVRDLLTDLGGVWQVKFDSRRCVAAVQRDGLTYIEVLDFGASRDGMPASELGRRVLVNHNGQETTDEEYDLSDDV